MDKCDSNEKLVLLATTIAIELSKGKSSEELKQIRILLGELYSTFCSLTLK